MCSHQDVKGHWTVTAKQVKETQTEGDFEMCCKQCGENISGLVFEHSR